MAKKRAKAQPETPAPAAEAPTGGSNTGEASAPDPWVSYTKVPGVRDSELHASLHEAHRVLAAGRDSYLKVLDQVEGQFVRPLLNAHDGDNEPCTEIKRQIAAFRSLYR